MPRLKEWASRTNEKGFAKCHLSPCDFGGEGAKRKNTYQTNNRNKNSMYFQLYSLLAQSEKCAPLSYYAASSDRSLKSRIVESVPSR